MFANQGEDIRTLVHSQKGGSDATLLQRDANVFYHQSLSSPVFKSISKVEGAYIFDGEGRKYLDLHGNGVHTVGYNNPQVLQRLDQRIKEGLTFAPRRFTNEAAVQLAEKLVEVSPDGLSRVLFCPGGSEAIEMATMLAKQTTGRWKTLSYYGTFHGAGFQSISLGADPHFREGIGPSMPGAIHLELPSYYRNPWSWEDRQQIDDEYLRQLRLQVEANPDIAALISEPIFYNSTVPTAYYWHQVKAICEQHGILLIFDEIYTAFGRTGKMFAAEHFVTPDILVVGKGFGGGIVPFAGIIGTEALNTLAHRSIGHYTHEKSPVCSTVAKAVIDYIEQHKIIEHTLRVGNYFKEGLEGLKEEFEMVGHIDGLGLNLSIDLVKNKNTKERAISEANELMLFSLNEGVSFKLIQGNILNLKPALIITKSEIDQVLDVLRRGLKKVITQN